MGENARARVANPQWGQVFLLAASVVWTMYNLDDGQKRAWKGTGNVPLLGSSRFPPEIPTFEPVSHCLVSHVLHLHVGTVHWGTPAGLLLLVMALVATLRVLLHSLTADIVLSAIYVASTFALQSVVHEVRHLYPLYALGLAQPVVITSLWFLIGAPAEQLRQLLVGNHAVVLFMLGPMVRAAQPSFDAAAAAVDPRAATRAADGGQARQGTAGPGALPVDRHSGHVGRGPQVLEQL